MFSCGNGWFLFLPMLFFFAQLESTHVSPAIETSQKPNPIIYGISVRMEYGEETAWGSYEGSRDRIYVPAGKVIDVSLFGKHLNLIRRITGKTLSSKTPARKYQLRYLWVQIGVVIGLHGLSALFSGLSLGLMSLTVKELEILKNAGDEKERHYARMIFPVRKKGNQLLATLLLLNTFVNTSISSSVSGKPLAFGARTLPVTQVCMLLLCPITWPISKILDQFVDHEHEGLDRRRILELMRRVIGKEEDSLQEQLKVFFSKPELYLTKLVIHEFMQKDLIDLQIATGALKLTEKNVADCMTPIKNVFMLSDEDVLDASVFSTIISHGYTRIPVFKGANRNKIEDVLIVKDLALLDPEDNFTVRTVCQFYKHRIHKINKSTPLLEALKLFRKGEDGHLAMVYEENDILAHEESQRDGNRTITNRDSNSEGEGNTTMVGIVTLEDVVEEILQEEIKDEFDKTREKMSSSAPRNTSPPLKRVSTQIQMVTLQFLMANERCFHESRIGRQVLEKLLLSCTKKVDITPLIAPSLLSKNGKEAELYKKDVPSDKYVLVLEGRAQVTIGVGKMKFEAGPFHSFGREILQQLDDIYYELKGKIHNEDLLSLADSIHFTPDFSLVVLDECTFIQVASLNTFIWITDTLYPRHFVTTNSAKIDTISAIAYLKAVASTWIMQK